MQSLYDDVLTGLTNHTFSIPNVNVRKPYDESLKVYPMIVLHEIVNKPLPQGTVNGETRTALSYQADILTMDCVDNLGTALTRWEAGRRLVAELSDYLDVTFKVTRRTVHEQPVAADVLQHIYRGDAVLDSSGYSYRL